MNEYESLTSDAFFQLDKRVCEGISFGRPSAQCQAFKDASKVKMEKGIAELVEQKDGLTLIKLVASNCEEKEYYTLHCNLYQKALLIAKDQQLTHSAVEATSV